MLGMGRDILEGELFERRLGDMRNMSLKKI